MKHKHSTDSYEVTIQPWQDVQRLAEKIKSLGYLVWLDSGVNSPTDYGQRYDILSAWPERMIYADGNQLTVLNTATMEVQETDNDPFLFAEQLIQPYFRDKEQLDFPFTGGLAGYWGYELNHIVEPERIKQRKSSSPGSPGSPDSPDSPDMALGLYLWSLVVDHRSHMIHLVFHPDLPHEKRHRILETLHKKEPATAEPFRLTSPFKQQINFEKYTDSFQKIKAYISAGDCYQVNLAQHFSAGYNGDLWEAYRYLRTVSPTPFSAYFDSGTVKILSHSPERFLQLYNRCVEAKPIKGTIARSHCPEEDKALAEMLLASEKDKAENLMIVDLLRNDLNKNCVHASVKVPEIFKLESFANVHHLVSTVAGMLRKDITPLELLRSSFPGGSITGAPKIRAMQIIRELEPSARSAYCGAIGYISLNHNMDTNIPIRTLVGSREELSCWGGGAIVADSLCEAEYNESMLKVANLTGSLEQKYFHDQLLTGPS